MIVIRILRWLIIGILVYFLFRVLFKGKPLRIFRKKRKSGSSGTLEEMKKDPVCGTYIPEGQAIKMKWNQETVYFCSEKCQNEFKKLHS